tara:strand:+ start:1759 stop:2805 length:1047 start_codon:yes stop_codon:yes gene_type:complete
MNKSSINQNFTIEESIKIFNSLGVNTLVVLDKNEKYLGTLTNGDIRRGILKTKSIKTKISGLYNKNSVYFYEDSYSEKKAKIVMIREGLDLIPILTRKRKIFKLIRLIDFTRKKRMKNKDSIGIDSIIMAGGLGTRMAPFTDILPKPLLPIKGKPVINYIIENFKASGINKCWITINYQSNLLRSYLKETKYYSNLNFYEEKSRLGTVGAVKNIIKKLSETFIITNCDTIIDVDYNQMIRYHKKNSFDITIVSAIKQYNLPYGVCRTDSDQNFLDLEEKPDLKILINSGMYIMNKEILKLIPDTKYDMTDLIKKAKKNKKKIGIYPISNDDWTDVGNWEIYKKVLEKI